MFRLFLKPTGVLSSVLELPVEELIAQGQRWFLFDLDNTVLFHGESRVTPEIEGFFWRIVNAGGKICFASNNPKKRTVTNCPHEMFCPGSKREWLLLRKPYGAYFRRLLEFIDAKPEECVMIGDKYGRDINGALQAGIDTAYLVSAMGKDMLLDELTFLREREARLLKKLFGIEVPKSRPLAA